MYLTRLRLDPASPAVQRDLRDPQELHRTVMSAFPNQEEAGVEARAFFSVLHRLEFDRRTGQVLLYVQSKAAPDWSSLPSGYDLAEAGVKPVGGLYDRIGVGQVLRFRLRANPTRKVDTKSGPDGVRRNGRRVPLNGVEAQVVWLARKAEQHGFTLVQATVAATGTTERVHSYTTGRTFQGVLYEGRLVVRDPERFREALAGGVGPGKAFGFGLLTVAPD